MGAMDISVIVPFYNTPLSSLRKQLIHFCRLEFSSGELEFIFVNNGSTDLSHQDYVQLVESYGFNCLFESKPGSYAARNKAISHCHGRLLIFTDDDCLPCVEWLTELVKIHNRYPNSIVGGNVVVQTASSSFGESYDVMTAFDIESYVKNGYCVGANLSLPKSLIKELGGFNGDLMSGGDIELTKKASSAGYQLLYSPEAFVLHPARTGREVLRKMRRVTVGHYEKNVIKGKNFKVLDYLYSAAKPIKILRLAKGYRANVVFKAFIFSFLVVAVRLYYMVLCQLGLVKRVYRT